MKSLRIRNAVAVAVFLLMSASVAVAQAGRRVPTRRETPPTPAPPSPTPVLPKTVKAQFTLKVVSDIPMSLYLVFPFPEHMQTWTVARLQKSPLLEVTVGDKANRPEAVRLAKAETEIWIVWLQLDTNPLNRADRAGREEVVGQVRVNVSILEPGTGKAKFSTSVFLGQSTSGSRQGDAERLCYPTIHGDDYLLLQASLQAAARIMYHLGVPVPDGCIKAQ